MNWDRIEQLCTELMETFARIIDQMTEKEEVGV